MLPKMSLFCDVFVSTYSSTLTGENRFAKASNY